MDKHLFSAIRGKGRFLRELSWTAFGQIASAIGLLVGIRLLTEYVPPAVYGNVTVLQGLTSFGYSVLCLPLFQAALRFFPDARKDGRVTLLRRTVFALSYKAAGFIALLLVAGGIVYGSCTGTSRWFGVLLAAMLLIDVCKNLETALLNAARRQREVALWNVAETWGRPIFAIVLVNRFQASPGFILLGYICASALVLLYFRSRGHLEGNKGESDRSDTLEKEIYRYALPLVPSALVGGVNSLSDRYIIGGMLGFEQVGIFAAASSLMIRPFVITCGIIEQSVRPIYFEYVAAENGSSKNILRKWLRLASGLCAAGFILIVALRHQVVNLLLAREYRSIVDLIPWLALGYAFYAISFIYENVFYAYKQTGAILRINIITAIATVIVMLTMTYAYGLTGTAISVVILNFMRLLLLRYTAASLIKQDMVKLSVPV